jgi:tRNA-dihydrouridine synthase
MMLTNEMLDTAAVYGNYDNLGLRRLGLNGRILNAEHAQDCCEEIADIVTGTTVIDGVAVKTDWLVQPEEISALVSLAFACKEFAR